MMKENFWKENFDDVGFVTVGFPFLVLAQRATTIAMRTQTSSDVMQDPV